MPVHLRPEIAALPPYRQGRPAAPDAFKLSSNESPFDALPAVTEAIAEATTPLYPDGSASALRARLAERFGVGVDEVHVAAGSVAILYQLAQAAAAPGDEILYSWRSFEAYPSVATVPGATSVQVPNLPDGSHDLDAMAAAVTDRTRLILVCTPNNPTGPIVTAEAFERFMAAVPKTVLVVLDEAYREFVTDPAAVEGISQLGMHENLVVLRTFSKAYGLAGLRVGYAVGPAYILDACRSTAIPLSVTEQAQRAALAALDNEVQYGPQIAEIVERRDRIRAALIAQGWEIPAAQGNFIWLPTGDATSSAAETLESHGIVARVFPGEGVRVSIGAEESVAKLLQATEVIVGNR
jgi:histidinol-phosphate aminotransferase